MDSKIHCKISFNNDIRRISLTSLSFSSIEATIREIFKIPVSQNISIQYKDDENDLVTISSDIELSTAVELCSNQILRLFIVLPSSQPTNVQPPSLTPDLIQKVQTWRQKMRECRKSWKGSEEAKEAWRKRKEMWLKCNNPGYSFEMITENPGQGMRTFVIAEPGQEINHLLKLKNTGKNEWPLGTKLIRGGCKLRSKIVQSAESFPLPATKPGEIAEVQIALKAPNQPGCYPTVWCISLPDGQLIRRAVVKVKVPGLNCEEAKSRCGKFKNAVQTLVEMGFEKNHTLFKLLGKHKCDVNAVVEELTREKY
eukprot:TRINITY_DN174_c0_g2_i1.p1 TRINITY_DN174_c0_g2~~TRINITY_DN174_c0_g2_i1.p1  ORF type:complete len:311 (+),score=39.09 TRINITY_DN174_c0_g2_i1:135-1067(+)